MDGLAKVLDYYGVNYKERHGWTTLNCPVPGHDDRRGSCRVNLEEGMLACLGCGFKGDALKLIEEVEGTDRASTEERFKIITGESYQSVRGTAHDGRRSSCLSRREEDWERGSGLLQTRRGQDPDARGRIISE